MFIVYETTCLVNNKIYVGVHETENPDIFDGYIGNSINIFNRKYAIENPKFPFHYAVKKYGFHNFKNGNIGTGNGNILFDEFVNNQINIYNRRRNTQKLNRNFINLYFKQNMTQTQNNQSNQEQFNNFENFENRKKSNSGVS